MITPSRASLVLAPASSPPITKTTPAGVPHITVAPQRTLLTTRRTYSAFFSPSTGLTRAHADYIDGMLHQDHSRPRLTNSSAVIGHARSCSSYYTAICQPLWQESTGPHYRRLTTMVMILSPFQEKKTIHTLVRHGPSQHVHVPTCHGSTSRLSAVRPRCDSMPCR